MNGIGERGLGASQLLHEKLNVSRVGRRWERIVRAHSLELESLMAIHPDLCHHVGDALCVLADRCDEGPALDAQTIAAVSRVLDDLQRLGGHELQSATAGLREELAMARGRSLADVLAG